MLNILRAAALMLSLSFTADVVAADASFWVEITADVLNVRSGPDASAAVVGRLTRGQRVRASDATASGWLHVQLSGNRSGYIAAEYSQRLSPGASNRRDIPDPRADAEYAVEVTGTILNVRARPARDSDVIARLTQGQTVPAFDTADSDWIRVRVRGQRDGFVAAPFVRRVPADDPAPAVPGENTTATADTSVMPTAGSPAAPPDSAYAARVRGDSLNVRSAPGTDARVVAKLERGREVMAADTDDSAWLQIWFGGDRSGYVASAYVARADAPAATLPQEGRFEGHVTAGSLNVRAAPDAGADVIARLSRNDRVMAAASNDPAWLAVSVPEGIGYVSADFVSAGDAPRGNSEQTHDCSASTAQVGLDIHDLKFYCIDGGSTDGYRACDAGFDVIVSSDCNQDLKVDVACEAEFAYRAADSPETRTSVVDDTGSVLVTYGSGIVTVEVSWEAQPEQRVIEVRMADGWCRITGVSDRKPR